jgi:hypothetical protein
MHSFVLSIFKVDRCNSNMNKNKINKIQYFSMFILSFKTLCGTSPNHSYPNGSQLKTGVHKCTWPVW